MIQRLKEKDYDHWSYHSMDNDTQYLQFHYSKKKMVKDFYWTNDWGFKYRLEPVRVDEADDKSYHIIAKII